MDRLRALSPRAWVIVGAVVLVLAAAVTGIALMLRPDGGGASASGPGGTSGVEVDPDMPVVPMAAPERVIVPSVGIDLAVLPDAPVNGVLDPPGFSDAYWIEDYGSPGTDADNTVYLAAHSSLRLDAAFNPLLDVDHQESILEPGDEVVVETANGRLVYEVTSTQRYVKGELPDADEVWDVEPGVLHLITCFQEEGRARADDNLVVTARLVSAEEAVGA